MKYYVNAYELLVFYNNYVHSLVNANYVDEPKCGQDYHFNVLNDFIALRNKYILEILKREFVEIENEKITLELYFDKYFLNEKYRSSTHKILSDSLVEISHELLFLLKGSSFAYNGSSYIYESNNNVLGDKEVLVSLIH